MRKPLNSRGQIVIPALFVVPSLFLFVFLIFETAKLSREKIRHQFAVDAASFVEMANYADFLNRTAYVNGAFPQRIFAEGYKNSESMVSPKHDSYEKKMLFDILYENGAFPADTSIDPGSGSSLDSSAKWKIRYSEPAKGFHQRDKYPGGSDRNKAPPSFDSTFYLTNYSDADRYWLTFDGAFQIYELWHQVYSLLGSVEEAQLSVFTKLTDSHNFFRKSYWLNTGEQDLDAARIGAGQFQKLNPRSQCIENVVLWGVNTAGGFSGMDNTSNEGSPLVPTANKELCSRTGGNGGLFQIMYIPENDLRRIRGANGGPGCNGPGANYPGYQIAQTWNAPPNYFRVNFNDEKPCVHATITLKGGNVWPDPTPKFQTRLYP